MKNEFKKQLIDQAIKSWALIKSTQEEKENWGYKSKLNFSYSFLINKTVYFKNKKYTISNIKFDKYKRMIIILNNGLKVKPTQVVLEIINPFSQNITKFSLNPARQLKSLLEYGFLLDRKYFKSIYYKSDEYRKNYEKSLELSTGVNGIKAPIQCKKIKQKISKTMQEKYGVDWFLKRGPHYNLITENIFNKYKHDNEKLFKILGVSKFELRVINCLLNNIDFSEDVFYFSKNKNQFYFNIMNKFKAVDFYDRQKNVVIEINGDFYHSNPEKYHEEDFNIMKNCKAKEIWENEEKVLKEISKKYGCKIFIIWESDWKNKKQQIINKIKNYCENSY